MKKAIFNKKLFSCLLFVFFFVLQVSNAQAVDYTAADLADVESLIAKLEQSLIEAKSKEATSISVTQSGVIQGLLNQAKVNKKMIEKSIASQNQGFFKQLTQWANQWTKEATWSRAFQSALSSSLNTIAYDTATWLGSGGKGQKPLFITEGWGEYLGNIGDNAAGLMLEEFGKVNGELKFNVCSPDLSVKLKIGMGLVDTYRKKKPICTFSKLKQNWEKELSSGDFLNKFQDMFNPTSNDFGIALTTQTGILEKQNALTELRGKELESTKGWLSVESAISGFKLSPPNESERRAQQVRDLQNGNFAKFTGSALADAANIFLNQLALTGFNTLMGKLGEGSKSISNPFDWSRLTNFGAGPDRGGISATKEKLKKIIEPNFTVRGDYNILTELSQCPDPNKAGPTNCVIDNKLIQAIQNKLTVGKAMEDGYLNKDGVFGFISQELEPKYNEGYPYRSMMILRKFRILPVGWEIAAQYIKVNQDKGPRNLGDLVACYSSSDKYVGYSESWCEGLVDPKWVLKAPLNYCAREGYGSSIISSSVTAGEATVTRDDKYCADEQSCIKENDDGSCKLYGYCIEERRKWNFSSDSCEPLYNTCETFKKSDNTEVSYLKNTLKYAGCTVDNAGCASYCTNFDYAQDKYVCTQTSVGDKMFFDGGAETCEEEAEGCRGLIRTKEGLGANLLVNSSFEEVLVNGGWGILGATSTESFEGITGLKLNTGTNEKIVVIGPVGGSSYNIDGESYALSFYSKNCSANSTFKLHTDQTAVSFLSGVDWQNNKTAYTFNAATNQVRISFAVDSADTNCVIDAIKLERGRDSSSYGAYGQQGLVYEKLAPEYLKCDLGTPPEECKNFAARCNLNDVGCELYTSQTDGTKVPAKASTKDYCVAECVGFDSFIQSESTFDSLRPENLIAKTAKTCNAQAAGCDEFTNLDKVAQGGEGIEYYSSLRQCIKASDGACTEFYSWEGSNETGYQLKVVILKGGLNSHPFIVNPAEEAVYGVNGCSTKLGESSYNPNCREFYAKDGVKSHHLYNNTVSCSENCHPYRRTEKNIVKDAQGNDISAAECNGKSIYPTENYKDVSFLDNQCILCKNGGTWDNPTQSCIYNAIPNEGMSCSAADNGCREYTGNTGQNIRVVFANDFEDATVQGWQANGGTVVSSMEAITLNGHSLYAQGTSAISLPVPNMIQKDKSYVLSFMAKSNSNLSLSAALSDGTNKDFFATTTPVKNLWQLYEISLSNVNHIPTQNEIFTITASSVGDFFIDNIKLTEISDRYYLIKNSWKTPDSCNQDLQGNPYANYMLGCDEYKDRDNIQHYLKSFSYLCKDSAVGCELMIDTQNSNSPYSKSFNAGAPTDDDVTVSEDKYIYAVYDKSKECNEEDKGCQRLGKAYNYDVTTLYHDAYIKNNPDKYDSSLCTSDAVDCSAYSTAEGQVYFRDPGDEACEWRQKKNAQGQSWLAKKTHNCDTNNDNIGDGNVCLGDQDCGEGERCLEKDVDVECTTDVAGPTKTFGQGKRQIVQPQGWAGICPADQSTCTELIDPVSAFSDNLVFNGDFKDLGSGPGSGWIVGTGQQIKVDEYTLYRLAGKGTGSLTIKDCDNRFYQLEPYTNRLGNTPNLSTTFTLDSNMSSIFIYTGASTVCTIEIDDLSVNNRVEFKKVVVDYQSGKDIDKSSCNGSVNFEEGCILFNQRSQEGLGLAGLVYDADNISVNLTASPDPGMADSNQLIKVTPDRVCDKWMTCLTKVVYKDNNGQQASYCSDIGVCNSVDDKGNCMNLISDKVPVNQTVSLPGGDMQSKGNVSGYSMVSYEGIDDNNLQGSYRFGDMKQKGELAIVPNGSFEFYSLAGKPMGWSFENGSWSENGFRVINNPVAGQTEGVRYPFDGKSFLKIGSQYQAISGTIHISPGTKYILSAYMNTLNLTDGAASIQIKDKANGNVLYTSILDARNDWTLKMIEFTSSVSPVNISLSSTGNSGNFYVDSVNIQPALNSRKDGSNDWNTTQACRLYAEEDSLSCEYYDDSGVKYKGWKGYCLQYDRQPGDPNTCLLWWPGERIKGDAIVEQSAGYQGQTPLYFCQEAEALIPVEKRKINTKMGAPKGPNNYCPLSTINQNCPNGYATICVADCTICGGNGGSSWDPNDPWSINCNATGTMYKIDTDINYGWFEYNGSLINTTTISVSLGTMDLVSEEGVKFYDKLTNTLFDDKMSYCSKIAKVVTETGENKYWSGRVFDGSKFILPMLDLGGGLLWGYGYTAPHLPFGSILQPLNVQDPYDWNGLPSNKLNNNPIYNFGFTDMTEYSSVVNGGLPYSFKNNTSSPYMGVCRDLVAPEKSSFKACVANNGTVPFTTDNFACPATATCTPFMTMGPFLPTPDPTALKLLKSIFAQSYGIWRWNTTTSHYVPEVGDWTAPETICPSTIAPNSNARMDCAYAPIVSNVSVNATSTSDAKVYKSGFINFTFNSSVDSQQLPLVEYVVDWGDGGMTTVSGVQIMDQPNKEHPHSLYRLYDYWNLKALAGTLGTNITCAADECRVQPSVRIKDNWGWCNGDTTGNRGDCSQFILSSQNVVVTAN